MIGYSEFEQRYMAYVDTFRQKDGTLSEPMARKLEHTMEVVRFAERIASAEGAGAQEFQLCRLAALFHDTARYKQVALHHTFNDTESKFDHGHQAVRIMLEHELLAGLPAMEQCAVLTAVELHNKPWVDFSQMGGIFVPPAKNVRDADKISILRLLTGYITGEIKFEDSSIFLLRRPNSPEITPSIIETILSGKPVLYKDLNTLNDFKISLFAWCRDLNYSESARMALEFSFYDQIRANLPDQPGVDQIYRNAMESLQCLSSKSAN